MSFIGHFPSLMQSLDATQAVWGPCGTLNIANISSSPLFHNPGLPDFSKQDPISITLPGKGDASAFAEVVGSGLECCEQQASSAVCLRKTIKSVKTYKTIKTFKNSKTLYS